MRFPLMSETFRISTEIVVRVDNISNNNELLNVLNEYVQCDKSIDYSFIEFLNDESKHDLLSMVHVTSTMLSYAPIYIGVSTTNNKLCFCADLKNSTFSLTSVVVEYDQIEFS